MELGRRDSFITHRAFCDALADSGAGPTANKGPLQGSGGSTGAGGLGSPGSLEDRALGAFAGDGGQAGGGSGFGGLGTDRANGHLLNRQTPGIGHWLGQGLGQQAGGMQQGTANGSILGAAGQLAHLDSSMLTPAFLKSMQASGAMGSGGAAAQLLEMDFSNLPQVGRAGGLQGSTSASDSLFASLFGSNAAGQGLEHANGGDSSSAMALASLRASGFPELLQNAASGMSVLSGSGPKVETQGMTSQPTFNLSQQQLLGSLSSLGGAGGDQPSLQSFQNLLSQNAGGQAISPSHTASLLQQATQLRNLGGSSAAQMVNQLNNHSQLLRQAYMGPGEQLSQLAALQALGLGGNGSSLAGLSQAQLQQLAMGGAGNIAQQEQQQAGPQRQQQNQQQQQPQQQPHIHSQQQQQQLHSQQQQQQPQQQPA